MAATQIEHDDVLLGTLMDDLFDSANIDGIVTKPSLRTIGGGSQQSCAGNDSRLSDDRTASGLRTASGIVATAAAPAPSAGQALVATGATAATWQAVVQVSTFVDNEIPSGVKNNSNKIFTLANTPIIGSEHVYWNGLRQTPGAGQDYTISGNTITFVRSPRANTSLLVDYRK